MARLHFGKHLSDRFDSNKFVSCVQFLQICVPAHSARITHTGSLSANKCKHIYSSPEDVDNSVLLNSGTYHRKWAKLPFVATYRRDNTLLLLLLAPKLHDECHRLCIWGTAAYKISKNAKQFAEQKPSETASCRATETASCRAKEWRWVFSLLYWQFS